MYFPKKMVTLSDLNKTVGTGWLPPFPDVRDYSDTHTLIKPILERARVIPPAGVKLAPMKKSVDLRQWCSPTESQGSLGSCSAHAGMGIVEYYERKAFGVWIDGSRLFLYKTTRNLMGVTGDTGAWLRNVMGALRFCGAAPEKYWPYTDKDPDFDIEPPAFVYAVADEYEALRYFCHDPLMKNVAREEVLASVQRCLRAGIPSMFGFYGFQSFHETDVVGGIPYPCQGETPQWGHAVVAVGYDDEKKIKNTKSNTETTGALLIRNSWGADWGEAGYGWLPY
ncbi:MAG: C1 family peptidase, partial [Bacteroidota bacterium]